LINNFPRAALYLERFNSRLKRTSVVIESLSRPKNDDFNQILLSLQKIVETFTETHLSLLRCVIINILILRDLSDFRVNVVVNG